MTHTGSYFAEFVVIMVMGRLSSLLFSTRDSPDAAKGKPRFRTLISLIRPNKTRIMLLRVTLLHRGICTEVIHMAEMNIVHYFSICNTTYLLLGPY